MITPVKAIVIGASAGAVEALSVVLPALQVGNSPPVLVVVHLPSDKKSVMVDVFRVKCKAEVKEAEDKEYLKNGTIYFAPSDYHLLVETDNQLSLSSEEPVLFSRPSIDVLFETAADAFGIRLMGIILTGANKDGAKGLKAVMVAGGKGIVQRPENAYASAMPQAAMEICPGAQILGLEQIAETLQKVTVQ